MKYFKIQYGFQEADYLPIKGDELHKAFALKMSQNGDGYFESGMVRAQDIIRIIPDWHRHFGWNRGYKMEAEDYAYTEKLVGAYNLALSKGKEIAEYAIENKNFTLLKLPASEAARLIQEKKENHQIISDEVKKLVDKMSK